MRRRLQIRKRLQRRRLARRSLSEKRRLESPHNYIPELISAGLTDPYFN
jgi:hypothetical protein